MQGMNWNDLRYILAIGRANSLAAAARQIAVDETTVGRRLSAIEASLGARLFTKVQGGRLVPTESGEVAMTHAERIEQEMNRLQLAVAGQDAAVIGTVRLTSVAVLINRLLLPAMPDLSAAHPGLLHDGRARNVLEAILWHDGEAAAARGKVERMSAQDRQALIDFIGSL